jgi:hypothetical protein
MQVYYHCHEDGAAFPGYIGAYKAIMNPVSDRDGEYESEYPKVIDAGQDLGVHIKFKKFEPRGTSVVNRVLGEYIEPDDEIIDTVTSTVVSPEDPDSTSFWPDIPNTSFAGNFEVKYCVRMYGPYSVPQTGFGTIKQTVCTGDPGQPSHFSSVNQSKDFKFTNYGSGYYYFQVVIPVPSDQPNKDTASLMRSGWSAGFDPALPEREREVVKFQPYFTSKVQSTFIDDISHNNFQIVDRISSHAAENLEKANINYDDDNDGYGGVESFWLDDDRDPANGRVQVRACVKAWGPYQQAQLLDYDGDGDTIPDRINSNNVPGPITSPIATICSDNTGVAGTGGTVAGGNFTGARQTRDFIFDTKSWTPGYYYFTEHMTKSNQPNTTIANNFLISDWHSKFNPMTTGDEYEDEATIEKFQIKPTSQTVTKGLKGGGDPILDTISTGITGDSNHNGTPDGGDGANNWNDRRNSDDKTNYTALGKDTIPVLKPADTYIEDSFDIRAYDTNSESDMAKPQAQGGNYNDAYWLKDLNGNYISFYVCATVYGPYSQPQGNGSSQSQRIPTSGIGQFEPLTIPANYNGSTAGRQHCFWTDEALSTNPNDGLTARPSSAASTNKKGGPGVYTVRWDNQGTNYFLPGYYYVVWSVSNDSSGSSVGDNTAENECTTTKNNCNTIVNIGNGEQIQQRNGDFLESSWWSPFGEQTESFYSQFQPIAKSNISEFTNTNNSDVYKNGCSIYVKDGKQYCYRETGCYISSGEQICLPETPPICSDTVINECIIRSSADSSSDNTSSRKKSTANSGDGGMILECDENKYSNLVNYVDNPEEYPHEKLHCHNVTDQIFLGAVDDKAISNPHKAPTTATHEVSSNNNRDEYWPKNKNGIYEPVKFQVKLYGPFKYPYSRTPSDDNKAGWAGGGTVTVVPKLTDGKSVENPEVVYGQPIAESCVISTANVGPNWDGTPAPYDAVFTQDINSCQGGTPSNSTIELTPGFYISIVEIIRDDVQNTNPNFVLAACDPIKTSLSDRQSNPKCSTQTMTRPHNMLIEDRFTSAWGDRRESILVPVPLYIVTRRDNSTEDTFIDQVTINDQYYIAGFSGEYVDEQGDKQRWTDIWGDPIPEYGTYSGQEGYVTNGNVPPSIYKYEHSSSSVGDYYSSDQPGDVHVNLYGAYPLEWGRPNESPEYCVSNKLVRYGTWQLPPKDTGPLGADLPYPAPLTLYEKGWYVFQYTYSGGDRITDIKTQCGDTSEMFRIVKNEIGLVTTIDSDEKTAPTRITDTVQVTGSFAESDKNSIVKLSLYKRVGLTNRPGIGDTDGAPICTVIFTVSDKGAYNTLDHIDDDGYPLADEGGSGRCYAVEGGHYYWIEEFLRPGSNPLNPRPSDYIQPIGEGTPEESIDILSPPVPEVTTDADPTTSVNKPFHDTALVTNIPDGNIKKYYLWFKAYGPFADGRVDCTTQQIYSNQSSPIVVTKNGRYDSEYITVSSNGIVYWVEYLEDEEGNIVDQGECGVRRENTYVVGPNVPGGTNPFEPFQVTPSYPDAGYISQQLGKVIVLGFVSMLGAWQLISKNSWLLRKR